MIITLIQVRKLEIANHLLAAKRSLDEVHMASSSKIPLDEKKIEQAIQLIAELFAQVQP